MMKSTLHQKIQFMKTAYSTKEFLSKEMYTPFLYLAHFMVMTAQECNF